jgi:hypothetical protein
MVRLGVPSGRRFGGQDQVDELRGGGVWACSGFQCSPNGTSRRGATGRMTPGVRARANRSGLGTPSMSLAGRPATYSGWLAQTVPWAQAGRQPLTAEHLTGNTVGVGNKARR